MRHKLSAREPPYASLPNKSPESLLIHLFDFEFPQKHLLLFAVLSPPPPFGALFTMP